MIVVVISLSVCLTIFIITSAIVFIRRRNRDKRYPGKIIAEPVVATSVTHSAPSRYTVTQIPIGSTTTSYQTQAYSTPCPPQGVYAQMSVGQTLVPGVHPNVTSYGTTTPVNMSPPPYNVAVSNVAVNQKQSTYYHSNYRQV